MYTRLNVEWQHDEATLYRLYRAEPEAELRTRWHGLWLLRQGHRARAVAQLIGVHLRSVRKWLAWYRKGGIEEVRRHRHGGRQGREAYLTPEQQDELVAQTAKGMIPTVGAAIAWVKERFGVVYSYWGMRGLFQRLKIKKKVPRPLGKKASLEAQEAWEKGDLRANWRGLV